MPDVHSKLATTAMIAKLIAEAPSRPGRTAIMKYLYFMKVIKGVPLPYNFRLYTYGPFDSSVLGDLRYAEALRAVESELVAYTGGRGYEYMRGPRFSQVEEHATEFLNRYHDEIDWVLKEFGNRSASELEMASTLVYVDRNIAEKRGRATIAELARKVQDIKPHLRTEAIEKEAQDLKQRGILTAIT